MALNSVSEDVRQLLNDNSKGTQGTDLFSFQWGSGFEGAETQKQILVLDTGNIVALVKDEYEQPTFSIQVRGSTVESVKTVYDRARDIYEFMIQQPRTTINTVLYYEFAPALNEILSLGKDENNRYTYQLNFFTYRCSI